MTARAYYNEFDPFAAAWLRQLIARNLIAPGDVDDRSILEVSADDLRGYTQHHFFAGIGGWSLALRMAGWPDQRPVWSGSAPCQPFSAAGKQKGKADERHLFPVWLKLIRQFGPATIFGEQVAGAIAHGWLDDIYSGLEPEGYAVGAALLPACAVGAPHKRERLWFVAHSELPEHAQPVRNGCNVSNQREATAEWREGASPPAGLDSILADAASERCGEKGAHSERSAQRSAGDDVMGDAEHARLERLPRHDDNPTGWENEARPVTASSHWGECRWIVCADGKARPIEPGIPLLAHGVRNRVGKLRGYGNAIIPQVAAKFIEATGLI